jgi:hypothetical protein
MGGVVCLFVVGECWLEFVKRAPSVAMIPVKRVSALICIKHRQTFAHLSASPHRSGAPFSVFEDFLRLQDAVEWFYFCSGFSLPFFLFVAVFFLTNSLHGAESLKG